MRLASRFLIQIGLNILGASLSLFLNSIRLLLFTYSVSSCWKHTEKRLLLPIDSVQERHDAKPSLVGKEGGEQFLIIFSDNIAGEDMKIFVPSLWSMWFANQQPHRQLLGKQVENRALCCADAVVFILEELKALFPYKQGIKQQQVKFFLTDSRLPLSADAAKSCYWGIYLVVSSQPLSWWSVQSPPCLAFPTKQWSEEPSCLHKLSFSAAWHVFSVVVPVLPKILLYSEASFSSVLSHISLLHRKCG